MRAHIDAIDEPRSAFSQPEALEAAQQYIEGQLTDAGYPITLDDVPVADQVFPNVIGEKEGTACPERVFIVGAHYDSVPDSPGADDNASGVAALLEAARVLADTDLPATVWFTAFAFEENGLAGSAHMADRAVAEQTQVAGMFSMDMIAYTTEEADFIAFVGNEASARLLDSFGRARDAYVPELPAVGLRVLGRGEEQPNSRRSDHAPFWDAGFQALLITDTGNFRNPNYHEPTDTIDTLDLDFATRVARLVTASTAEYLTFDGDGDGRADACTGPLAATPTPLPAATAGPADTPAPAAATPAAAGGAPLALPDTGTGARGAGGARLAIGVLAAAAVAAGAANLWLRRAR